MLGKLLKYEFRATGKTFIPLYGIILLMSLVNRIAGVRDKIGILQRFTVIILVSLFIALGVMTLVVLVQRFSKNLLGDEGYLMFTLPVKSHQLITSKLITTIVWGIASGIVGILSGMILFADKMFFRQLWAALPELIQELSNGELYRAIGLMIGMLILCLLGYAVFILIVYVSMSITQIPKFNRGKMLATIGTFLIISTLLNWGGSIGIEMLSKIFPDFNGSMGILEMIGIAWSALVACILFMTTNIILRTHLNLE